MSHAHSSTAAAPISEQKNLLVKNSVWEFLKNGPLRVAIIGSGNWGSAIAKIIGNNTQRAFFFEKEVKMYVFEEVFKGRKLTEIINETHINEKYLPGIKLPENIVACPDVRETVWGAHVLVFVMPHQFVKPLCKEMQGHIVPGAKAISLVKGFDTERGKINLMSEYIRSTLNIECSSLSGANVAEGVAKEEFSETTIGYEDIESAQLFQALFDTPYFRVNAVPDVAGVEICGALKNVIAMAAGFVDGLGYGSNTKAAILRLGMLEMRKFAGMFYPGTIDEVLFDSAGLADLLTTCYGISARNRRCAEEFVKTGKSWAEIERTLLKGQKLQGIGTCRDIHAFLTMVGKKEEFPLMTCVYEIADTGKSPKEIVNIFMSTTPRTIVKTKTPISLL